MQSVRYWALAAGFAAMMAGQAVLAATTEELKVMLENGQNEEAFAAAQAMRADQEGDPTFDFLYGKAAYLTQHYHEAMFALERAVYAQPEDVRSRYVLAKTYYAMGNHDAAQREFKIVQANNPPADIAEDVNHYLIGLQNANKKPSVIAQVEAFVGHDDNINRATGDSFVNFPFFSLPVLPGARQQSDMYRQVGGNIQYYQPTGEGLGVIIKGGVTDKDFFSSDDFDETIYNGSATLNKRYDADTFKLGVSGQSYQLSGSTYSVNRAVETSWYHETGGGHGFSAGFNYNESDYPGSGLFNVDQRAVHAGIHRRYGNRYHSLTFMFTDEDADNATANYNARNTRYWFYDFNLYADARNSFQSRLLYSETTRDAVDPAFLLNRDDDYLSFTLAWQWRYDQNFMVITRLGVSDNDSDIKVYEYERQYIETGVRYTF